MDQIKREKVLEKLGKIKALAERGVGGEKETALRMYEELCRKYDISEDEAEAALAQLEKMNDEQVKAVLAFINSLDDIEKSFSADNKPGE